MVANINVSDAETHAKFFGKPCLGDTSFLQMLLNQVAVLFLLFHRMIIYLDIDYKVMNL